MVVYDRKVFKTTLTMNNEYNSWTSAFDLSVSFDESPNGSAIIVVLSKELLSMKHMLHKCDHERRKALKTD